MDYELSKLGITDLYVCGVATDFCVGATAIDALELNYRVVLVQDACRGVVIDDINAIKLRLIEKGAVLVDSNEVRFILIECLKRNY